MNILYIIGGIASLSFGIYDIVNTVKKYNKGKEDKLGADIKIFGAGICFLMIGIYLIVRYI